MTKRTLVSVHLLLALLMLIAVTRVWVRLTLEPSAATVTSVAVTGSEGISTLMPIAVALFAVGLVLTIAGTVFRFLLGFITAVFGGWSAWTVWSAVERGDSRLRAFSAPKIADTTGLITAPGEEPVTQFEVTFWPWLAIVAGLFLVVTGILVMVFGKRWKRGGKRYETHTKHQADVAATRQSRADTVDRIADWDALSDGEDPSDGTLHTHGEVQDRAKPTDT